MDRKWVAMRKLSDILLALEHGGKSLSCLPNQFDYQEGEVERMYVPMESVFIHHSVTGRQWQR